MQALSNLSVCIKYGNGEVPSKNFKYDVVFVSQPAVSKCSLIPSRALLKMILGLIESKNSVIVIAALQTLSKILRSSEMQGSWSNFLELIVLKYIDNYKTSKEVCQCFYLSYKTTFHPYFNHIRFNVKLI